MQKIRIVFTKRKLSVVSLLIRWALPRSRFAMARSSHSIVVDGDFMIEATMLHGVRRERAEVIMKGQTVVRVVEYQVPDAEAGLAWARDQVGRPYDFRGAFGLALSPGRDWMEPDRWFCYELVAATLAAAGRDVFANTGHITEAPLLAIKP